MQGAVDGVPPGDGRRRLADRRDGQDRRPVLLLQADPAHAADPAAVDAQRRPRRRTRQHRAGGLRRRRARPHQSPFPRQRPLLPPGRSGRLPDRRRARHLQQGRARAEDEPVRQRGAVRLHPEEREEGPDGTGAGAPCLSRGDQGPGRAGRHADVRQLSDSLRPPRDRRRAEGQRHRVPEPERLRLAAVGLLGAPSRPGAVHRPQPEGHGRRQGGAGDRRLVGHRPARRASSPRPARDSAPSHRCSSTAA